LQLDKTRCRQALRKVPLVHLHGKALPKLLQSFEFANWFAIFAKTSFFGLSSTLAKLVLLLIVHDLATPHDAFDDNAGRQWGQRKRFRALLKAPDKVRPGMPWLLH
jgi:hypothetical protein